LPTGHTPPGATLAKKGSHSFGPTGEAGLRLLATYATASPTGQRRGTASRRAKGSHSPHWPLTGQKGRGGEKAGLPYSPPTDRLAPYAQPPSPLPSHVSHPSHVASQHAKNRGSHNRLLHNDLRRAFPSYPCFRGNLFGVFPFFRHLYPPLSFFFFHHLKVQENMGNMGSRLITLSLTATYAFPCF